jgi:hypothetical protein
MNGFVGRWSLVLTFAAASFSSACLGGRNATREGSPLSSEATDAAGVLAESWVDASGMDGKGGVMLYVTGDKKLPRVKSDYDKKKRGDVSVTANPAWQLFFGEKDTSAALQFIWVTHGSDKHYEKTWGGCGIAFNPSWSPVDGTGAKYLVMWVKSSHPKVLLSAKFHFAGKPKDHDMSGEVMLAPFAPSGNFGEGEWQRLLVPLSEFSGLEPDGLKSIDWISLNLRDNPPEENKKFELLIDNVYLSAADMVTPVSNPGYLVRSDGVLLLWDKETGRENIAAFSISADGKPIAEAPASARSVFIPRAKLGEGKLALGIRTKGESESSSEKVLSVDTRRPKFVPARVALSTPTHEVSRYVLGSNYGPDSMVKRAGSTLRRWGGNATTKYNWKFDVGSSASDWYFLNAFTPRRSTPEQERGWYTFIQKNRQEGADVNLTIPIIDRIAKPAPDEQTRYCSFPASKYPEQQSIGGEGCGNGKTPDGRPIWGNDVDLATVPNSSAYQKEWVEQIVKSFGTGANGGVKFYTLDNEPGLWNVTHRDVMPKGISAEELADRSIEYASMIKSVDPTAHVIGFAAWGPMELAGSNLDYTPPGEDGYKRYGQFADEGLKYSEVKKHGGDSQLVYLLKRFKAAEAQAGKRLIDAIDVHWYPQLSTKGDWKNLSDDAPYDADFAELQWEVLREWYDPAFAPEGGRYQTWLDDGMNRIRLWDPYHPVVPALKRILETHYPGTKLAINEYNSGSESHYHGALIRIALLGVFMRENLFMAQNWHQTDEKTFTYWGQKLYGNYDDKGSKVLGRYVPTTSSNPDLLTFATLDGASHKVLLVNKNAETSYRATLELPGTTRSFALYRLAQNLGLRLLETRGEAPKEPKLVVDVPAYSAVLVVTN